MISKDLMNLINAYNENGIYFLFSHTLWWFNGKRIEKWCYCPDISRIFVDDGNLYARTEPYREVFILENQSFKYCGILEDIFDIEDEHINPWYICFDDDDNLYTYARGEPFQKNGNPLPRKKYYYNGNKLLYYDGFLYYFSFDFKGQNNEKFDIKTNQWSFFNDQLIYENWISDIYLLNNIFYTLFGNGKIGTYNPKTDTWQKIDISLPKK